jgi:restriction endonuclease S subunit
MIASEVLFSRLEDRIDAGFYATKIQIEERLKTKALDFEPMGTLCDFPKAKTPPQESYTDSGIPVLKLKNITDYFIDWGDVSFVPERLYPNLFQPKKEDLLITATGEGTIGRVNIFNEDEKCIVTGEVMIIRPHPQKVNPYFLLTYLRCKYGKPQLIRFVRGATGQTHLYSKDIKQILVPIPSKPFQEHIEKLVKEAHEKRKLADQRYKEAEQLLYKELGIKKLELTREKTFETTFSTVKKTMRFDPECYKPEYIECEGVLKNINSVPLSSVATPSKARFDPNNAPTQYFSYIDISNVDIRTGEVELQKIRCYEAPTRARKKVELDDVIISTVRPNRNAIAIIDEVLDDCVCSTGFSVIKPERINPYCLFLFLKTEYTINQLVKKTTASMYPAISEQDIFNLLVPIPSRTVQEDIEKMIRETFKLRKEAKNLLDQAKTEVEELIDKNG